MNTEDLVLAFRDETGDVDQPYHWSDRSVLRYISMAQIDFTRRLGGIPSSYTINVDAIPLKLPQDVLGVHSASREGECLVVAQPTGECDPCAQGRYDLEMTQDGMLRWVGAPRVTFGGLLLGVGVLPNPMFLRTTADELEVHPIHRPFLVYFALSEAYKKHDAETYDRVRQDQYLMMYEQYVTKCNRERFAGTLRLT